MPDVILTDDLVGGGSINTTLEASSHKIWGSHIAVDVEIEPSQVRVRGIEIYMRIHVRWNGSTSAPTILAVWPSSDWTTSDVVISWFSNVSVYEWLLEINTYASGSRHIVLGPIEAGSSFSQVTTTGFSSSAGGSYQQIGFIMKDANGTAIYPLANEECWLLVVPD